MMHLNINNQSVDDHNNPKKSEDLTSKERAQFHQELDDINQLIEDSLGLLDDDETISQGGGRGAASSFDEVSRQDTDSLEIKQSYNDAAKRHQERLQRLGILKSDPTGRRLKAAGED
ncbi:MAG: hypothetical protein ACO3K7_00380 [Candidatus Marinamargulisbacteria bacterium]